MCRCILVLFFFVYSLGCFSVPYLELAKMQLRELSKWMNLWRWCLPCKQERDCRFQFGEEPLLIYLSTFPEIKFIPLNFSFETVFSKCVQAEGLMETHNVFGTCIRWFGVSYLCFWSICYVGFVQLYGLPSISELFILSHQIAYHWRMTTKLTFAANDTKF